MKVEFRDAVISRVGSHGETQGVPTYVDVGTVFELDGRFANLSYNADGGVVVNLKSFLDLGGVAGPAWVFGEAGSYLVGGQGRP